MVVRLAAGIKEARRHVFARDALPCLLRVGGRRGLWFVSVTGAELCLACDIKASDIEASDINRAKLSNQLNGCRAICDKIEETFLRRVKYLIQSEAMRQPAEFRARGSAARSATLREQLGDHAFECGESSVECRLRKPEGKVAVGKKQGFWGVLRLLMIVTVLAVFAVGIYWLADYFVSGADQPADINIPPAPPPAFNKD
jgi:hypothetical protein